MLKIRAEKKEDIQGIRQINLSAFEGPTEADLVDLLRDRGKLIVSLVAEHEGQLVGHIAFSRVIIDAKPDLQGVGLAPMAVIPDKQRQGIGSSLVRAGLEECRQLGYGFSVVLGHAHYYPRFGFRPAKEYRIKCQWDVPDDVFMALELRQGTIINVQGMASYEPEFNTV